MASQFIIDIFKPADFQKKCLNMNQVNEYLDKSLLYSSKGRYALYHILRTMNAKGKILLPAYICDSILEPVKLLNLDPIFYDLDINDLNASIDSIEYLSSRYKCSAILVASMYGNPANMSDIEKLCKDKKILFIDDASQSFGAKLNDKLIGTFGDSGFFSFSPGKPLAGHMGAFYWTNKEGYNYKCTHNKAYHYLAYLDYYYNRLNIYKCKKLKLLKFFSYFIKIMNKFIDIKNDDICEFEEEILGGIWHSFINGNFQFRNLYFEKFYDEFKNNSYFSVIKNIRGISNNHKIVILANNKMISSNMIEYLRNKKIFCLNGYDLLDKKSFYLENAISIDKRVIEIPIENDENKMNYLFETISKFRG